MKTTDKIKNVLTIKVKVDSEIEAYAIVSELGFDYEVLSAEVNGHKERFDNNNRPAQFLKDNSKNNKVFRDIRAERFNC